ncbi:hypothetical protein MD484_g6066, partial [Candolleomyces efflorescens]
MNETFEPSSEEPTQGSQLDTDTRRQVAFTTPPSAAPRTPRKPKRASKQKLPPPPTPYARTLFKNARAREGNQQDPTSSNAGPSSNEDPFTTLEAARPRRLIAEPTLCPTVCPTCLQPMPANSGDTDEGAPGQERSLDDVAASMSANLSVSPKLD